MSGLIASPTRTNLHWPLDVYARFIRGELTEAEADAIAARRASFSPSPAMAANLAIIRELRAALASDLDA